jgi:hypothetical protein
MTLYGYARVSTRDQDLAGQVAELTAAGCASVFREKVSGAKTDRAELAKVIRRLEAGDVLVVSKAGPTRALNQGPPERLGGGVYAWCRLPIPEGCLGGHHHPTRQAHADRSGWLSRVRT